MEPNTPAESNTQGYTTPSVLTKSSSGPIIGAVIIIVLLVFGGLYVWMQGPTDKMSDLPLIPGDPSENEAWIPESTTSDAAADIEAELTATDMDAFEAQMNADAAAASKSL